jgi:hypothetical protein
MSTLKVRQSYVQKQEKHLMNLLVVMGGLEPPTSAL